MIRDIAVSRGSFAPALGEIVSIRVSLARPLPIQVAVLDRDGVAIRHLKGSAALATSITWDGRDDHGDYVPDEAYAFRVEALEGARVIETLTPGRPVHDVAVAVQSFDRRTGVISYTLPEAARIHLQAGIRSRSGNGGAVLKTIVNREPRTIGRVIEMWNGLDDGGTILVRDLPNFVLAIAATSLPEHAVITVGNRKISFVQYAARRALPSRISKGSHAHHRDLSTLEDVSPALTLAIDRQAAGRVAVRALPTGPAAPAFMRQPGKVLLAIDGETTQTHSARQAGAAFTIDRLPPGEHVLSVNWVSDYGPVAAAAMRIGGMQ